MDKTSSMYLYVKLNWDANRFLPAESKDGMNSASYEYRNMSARRGAQFWRLEYIQKQQQFFPHASRSLLSVRFVAINLRSEKDVCWRRDPLWPILVPLWIQHRWIWLKTTIFVGDRKNLIPTKLKFHQNPSSGYVVKADYVFPFINMHKCNPLSFA